jgi:hypothetical protein
MDDPKLAQYVCVELKKQRRVNDIVAEVCAKTGVNWREAEEFVLQVEAENRLKISGAQNPVIIILSILFILVGFAILFYWVANLMQGNVSSSPRYITMIGFGAAMVVGGFMGVLKR